LSVFPMDGPAPTMNSNSGEMRKGFLNSKSPDHSERPDVDSIVKPNSNSSQFSMGGRFDGECTAKIGVVAQGPLACGTYLQDVGVFPLLGVHDGCTRGER
jgi:hypothetical protein